MVDPCAQVSGLEEVHTVEVRYVNSSLIGRWAVGAILLDVHAEEAHVSAVDVLKCKQGLRPVGEGLGHLATVYEPGQMKDKDEESH